MGDSSSRDAPHFHVDFVVTALLQIGEVHFDLEPVSTELQHALPVFPAAGCDWFSHHHREGVRFQIHIPPG